MCKLMTIKFLIFFVLGDCRSFSHRLFPHNGMTSNKCEKNAGTQNLTLSLDTEDIQVSRYGHRTVQLTNNQYLTSGGFGVSSLNGGHSRLDSGVLLDFQNDSITKTQIIGGLDEYMYHTVTRISDGKFLVIGGRKSPKTPITKYGVYEFKDGNVVACDVKEAHDETASLEMVSRWRHSAVYYQGKK